LGFSQCCATLAILIKTKKNAMKQTLSRTLNRSVIAVALACTLSACQVTNIDADQQFTQVAENIVN